MWKCENEAFTAFYTIRDACERSLIGWVSVRWLVNFDPRFDAGSDTSSYRLSKEWVQKCLPNFAKYGPIVTKFCTMIEEALGYL